MIGPVLKTLPLQKYSDEAGVVSKSRPFIVNQYSGRYPHRKFVATRLAPIPRSTPRLHFHAVLDTKTRRTAQRRVRRKIGKRRIRVFAKRCDPIFDFDQLLGTLEIKVLQFQVLEVLTKEVVKAWVMTLLEEGTMEESTELVVWVNYAHYLTLELRTLLEMHFDERLRELGGNIVRGPGDTPGARGVLLYASFPLGIAGSPCRSPLIFSYRDLTWQFPEATGSPEVSSGSESSSESEASGKSEDDSSESDASRGSDASSESVAL
ncbi:hypothetical protein PM082_021323 [Marasmius tenuissimus]|nr:hypothetical protein PM082_021323 [Marasmius tenuissimus]